MTTNSRTLLMISIAVIFSMAGIRAYAGALDGKTFSGPTGMMGKGSTEKDEVRFENDTFISVGCKEWGFGPGAYLTSMEGDNTHFVADTYSDKEGRIVWIGTISGNDVDATYLWYKKGKDSEPEQIKWFKGAMK